MFFSMAHCLAALLVLLASCSTTADDITSFTSNDGLFCAHGPSRVAESALAIKKAGPIGGLFNTSFGVAGKSCASRGYNISNGDDPCTPGVITAFKTREHVPVFATNTATTLVAFAETYNLSTTTAQLMFACTCHAKSVTLLAAGANCTSLNTTVGSWMHRDPYSNTYNMMMCDEGPFVLATRALSVLKSSPQLAMHMKDQIAATSCKQQGFPVLYPASDHCYPPMHVYTKTTPIQNDPGVLESVSVEGRLTCNYTGCNTTGFVAFAKAHGIDNIRMLNNNLGCNCLARSSVGKEDAKSCWSRSGVDTPHSPVRDWWRGEF